MKIAYLFHWNEGPESGVYKKIVSQVKVWSDLGHEVRLFVFTGGRLADWQAPQKEIETVAVAYESLSDRFPKFRRLARQVEAWQPDVIYHRYDMFYPPMQRLLQRHPIVLEINSNDLTEMKRFGKLRYWYHRMTRARVLKGSKGHVFVSQELSEERLYHRYTRQPIVIGNGIELDSYSPLDRREARDTRLVFIGSPGQPWHGVDKIVQLAAREPGWAFDLIGLQAKDAAGSGEKLPTNLVFHGRMSREQYQPIMEQATAAIGSLAMHRTSLKEGSPLKVREYLAYGIPVIVGYRDTDFPGGQPFLLELPNEQDNVVPHLERIRSFVLEWAGKRIEREAIRHLDTKEKERIRIDYMKRLVTAGERP
ncbi:glycosyltransferase family 4 protein [Cohnella zeiphila]|uniref:Glycosyltransferase family 4 protein n=1 Tax=Cohnella zeiphila TaxID=2761120 RepID=A0A7X0SNG1_9BACL|nr:glycosyltransferase family 4 protein [Cohnella zeiphila]MBB6733061.1 glycosyltransferase family 4 protein [Cohnella zeiphila]